MVKQSLQAPDTKNSTPPKKAKKSAFEVDQWRKTTMHILANYFRLLHGIEFYGQSNIPSGGPLIIVANHPTYYDPVLIGKGIGALWAHWLCWDEAFTWPVIGPWIASLGAIPVNLDNPGADILRQSLRVLRAKKILGIFFEGQRSTTPLIEPPLPGAASIALRTGTPIMPVTISGAYRVWPHNKNLPQFHGQIRVIYHPVINVERMRGRSREAESELTQQLKQIIQWPLTETGAPFRLTRGLSSDYQPCLTDINLIRRA